MAQDRDDLVYLAKLAEQAERFDEMAERRRGDASSATGRGRPAIRIGPERRIDKGGARERTRRRARLREPARVSQESYKDSAPAPPRQPDVRRSMRK